MGEPGTTSPASHVASSGSCPSGTPGSGVGLLQSPHECFVFALPRH